MKLTKKLKVFEKQFLTLPLKKQDSSSSISKTGENVDLYVSSLYFILIFHHLEFVYTYNIF